jgi:retron-type reverse transcriptase
MIQFGGWYEVPQISRLTDMDNLHTGWQRVRDNQGCAGADGVTIETFESSLPDNLSLLAREISSKTYRPLPLLRIFVDKGNGESWALSIPAVRDRVAQSAALNILEPIRALQLCLPQRTFVAEGRSESKGLL